MALIPRKRKGFAALSVAAIMLMSGCSSMEHRDIGIDHLSSDVSYYGLPYAKRVVENIEIKQAERTDQAWAAGVSFSERMIAARNGVDPYVGWSPKIDHPSIEEHTKAKYKDAIELGLLFEPQPVEVTANDEVILVTMPQNWVWTYSDSKVSDNANVYLRKMIDLLDLSDVRFSIYAQESITDTQYGKQWMAEAKAKRFRDFLITETGVMPSQISSFGLGQRIADSTKYMDGDMIQIVVFHKYDVDSSDFSGARKR